GSRAFEESRGRAADSRWGELDSGGSARSVRIGLDDQADVRDARERLGRARRSVDEVEHLRSDHRRIGAAGPLSSGDDEDPPRVPGGSAGEVGVEAKRLSELDLRLGITLAANGVEEVAADLGG